jgi:tryptophan-rich sensory protein
MITQPLNLSIFAPSIVALVVNMIIFATGLNNRPPRPGSILPPGWLVGLIWILVFLCFGYVHTYLSMTYSFFSPPAFSIFCLMLYCIVYPFVTGLDPENGLILNTLTLIFSALVSSLVVFYEQSLYVWMLPSVLWSSYVVFSDSWYYANNSVTF